MTPEPTGLELLHEFPLRIQIGIIEHERSNVGDGGIFKGLKHSFTCDLPSICICDNYCCLARKQFRKHPGRAGHYSRTYEKVFGVGGAL